MNEASGFTCSLDADEYRERLAAIRAVAALGLVRATELPDGILLSFRDTTKIRDELTAIVRAESECCPFLGLLLERQRGELLLTVSGPGEALILVRELTEAFATEEAS